LHPVGKYSPIKRGIFLEAAMKQMIHWHALSILLAAILTMSGISTSQTVKGSVGGTVKDKFGAVLQGARIELKPGTQTVVSDTQGQFFISNLNSGTYTLTISYSGFQTFTTTVNLTAGQATRVDATLQVAAGSESITVIADTAQGQAEAINREIDAPNIMNVLTNQQIMSLPNFTIADAVGRLPGVTLERDEGDGKYIQIRGTEPELTNTTIDGINVPSPEAQVRQVKLDTVPADIVESVEVNKTLSANQDADGIGGSVNLVTRTAGEAPQISGFGQGGYTPIFDGRHASQYGITMGKRYLSNKKLGILGNYTYDYNGRGIDDIEPSNDTGTVTPSYDSIDIREYRYDRTRWGVSGSSDYKLSEGSSIYIHGLYSDFKDYGDKWVYTLNNNVSPASTPTGDPATFTGANPQFTNSTRLPDYGIGTLALGGKHQFRNSWLTWEISAARSRQSAAGGDPGTNFTYDINGTQDVNPGDSTYDPLAGFTYNNCFYNAASNPSKFRPQWLPACTAKGSPIFNTDNYVLTELDLTSGQTTQINLQAMASYAFNYHAGSHFSTFEFGFKIRNGHKGQYAYAPALINTGTDGAQGAPTGPTMTQFPTSLHNNHYYGGSYNLGPLMNYDAVLAFNNANPGVLVADPLLTALNGDAGNFNYEERVTAGYLMNTVQLGRVQVQAGVRFEATNLRATGYQVITTDPTPTDPSGYGGTVAKNESSAYLDVFPSVQTRIRLTNSIALRAVYARALSRPDPQDIVPSLSIDRTKHPNQYSYGNPALVAEHAHDFDLLYEQDLKPLGLLHLGYFYKFLGSPIVNTTEYLVGGNALCPETAVGQPCKVNQIVNAGRAWVGGFEAAYQQRMSYLPGFLSGVGFFGNYTYVNSEAFGVDPLRTQVPKLLRQSPNAWNIGPSYDHGPLSMNLGIEYNGANIDSYQYEDLQYGTDQNGNPTNTTIPNPQPGGVYGPAGDNYFYTHMQVDAQISYRLKKGFSLYASGQNLTNEVFGFYNGGPQYVNQREYYKPTYFGGLRWTLRQER
jgi:TonB-dependent receptor